MDTRVAIIGIGGVSNLGVLDASSLKLPEINIKKNIANNKVQRCEFPLLNYIRKKKDAKVMSYSQSMAVFSAGHALNNAKQLGEDYTLEDMDIFLSCSVGDRIERIDDAVLSQYKDEAFNINTILKKHRPTMMLQLLPSLFLSNISINYGATGESVAFVGDAAASVNCLDYAIEKVLFHRSKKVLSGGVFNGDQKVFNELTDFHRPRGEYDEITFGCSSTFLVLEDVTIANNQNRCLAQLAKITDFDITNIENYLREHDYHFVSIMHELSDRSVHLKTLEALPISLLNINDYVGNLFEASLHTQILLSLIHFQFHPLRHRKVLLICEVLLGEYQAYSLVF